MKFFKINNDISNFDVTGLAQEFKIPPRFAQLLVSRGINTKEKIEKYLYSDKNSFHDPFLLKGMEQTIQRLKIAINNNEKVVIYGDYDADGICAAAILSLCLAKNNVETYVHIPDREGDGYGLNIDSLTKIIEDTCPDLILTCDCGISNIAEVEAVLDLGVDIIVTDHHTVSDQVPDCVVINPKQKDCMYPFKDLCGAGVALKVAEALCGEDAYKFCDLAAIASIADLVELTDENRLIVQKGLQLINSGKGNPGLTRLCAILKLTNVTSSDLAYKIAPRINAAGRMGDPFRAYSLLTTVDVQLINSLVEELERDNALRKERCDTLYKEAIDILYQKKLDERLVFIAHETWEKGLTGITAARLSTEFKRPTFILMKSDSEYRGTSRSIAGINIYDILSASSHLLSEFGGHAQAAGFSVSKENIPKLYSEIKERLSNIDSEFFGLSQGYDIEISEEDITTEFVKNIQSMEPFGNGNAKPLFLFKATDLKPTGAIHLNLEVNKGLRLTAFNYGDKRHLFAGHKEYIIELSNDSYRGGIKGTIKAVYGEPVIKGDEAESEFIKTTAYKLPITMPIKEYFNEDLNQMLQGSFYGDLIIAGSPKSFSDFIKNDYAKGFYKDVFTASSKNNYSRVILSPQFDPMLTLPLYKRVFFLDSPPNGLVGFINSKTDAQIFVPKTNNFNNLIKNISVERDVFAKYYDIIKRNSRLTGVNVYDYFYSLKKAATDISLKQFIACLIVFSELGFVTINKTGGFKVGINSGVKAKLTDSESYNVFAQGKE